MIALAVSVNVDWSVTLVALYEAAGKHRIPLSAFVRTLLIV